ncbi:hypothetical protein AKJ16_DCAP20499 [Drosera capensis]
MTGVEEMSGPAGPKLIRLISFVGAGFVCVFAINKWRDYERRSLQRKNQLPQTPAMTTNEIHGAITLPPPQRRSRCKPQDLIPNCHSAIAIKNSTPCCGVNSSTTLLIVPILNASAFSTTAFNPLSLSSIPPPSPPLLPTTSATIPSCHLPNSSLI